jgi:alpha-L-rhamnosidase
MSSWLAFVLGACALMAADAVEESAISVLEPRCEFRSEPLGIDVAQPRLSWQLSSSTRGEKQTAYRILVATTLDDLRADRGDLWDSGRVESEQSIHVLYEGEPVTSGQRCYWTVRVWGRDDTASEWSEPTWWEMGLLGENAWQGSWISDGVPMPETDAGYFQDDPAPLFRKEFAVKGEVRSARLSLSGLGYVEASVNGRRIGDHELDPAWTIPDKRVYSSTYDLDLQQGSNCIGVTLGNGWYNPLPLRMWGRVNLRERLIVGRPQFIAQLQIEYADGTSDTVVSDATWKVAPGPILQNSIYLGEKVDARQARDGWDRPGHDDREWKAASIATAPAGRVEAQPLPPIKVTGRLKPVSISEPAKGTFIVDMGQNFGGLASFTFDVPRGTEIKIRYGELLNTDGSLNPLTSVCGQIKRKEPGADGSPAVAWQADTYIAKGDGPETYTPRFTFHAFRYIEITGLPSPPRLQDIVGLRMNSAVESVGTFTCSNEQYNRVQTMCEWTFLSNLFGVQSDCPHRERFGYGGDLVVTSDAFLMNYDMATFYANAARQWHDSALSDGMLTDTAPSVGIQYCGVGWAMAHPHLVTQLYRYYGDRRMVEEQYPTAKRWLELVRQQNPDFIVTKGLHDHEALAKDSSAAMVTPLYCESARMVAALARILGKDAEAAEYEQLAESIRRAYVEKFLTPGTGKVSTGIQGAQAFALFLDMLPEHERAAAFEYLLHDLVDTQGGKLTTGIFGTRFLLDILSRQGRADLIHPMVTGRDFPGWGHMLDQGATTLWEDWKFSDNTYSHNHPMFGSISQWFYNWPGGIQPEPDAVAFDRFRFQPWFAPDLDWVRCTHRSIRSPITCNWKREPSGIALELRVPVGTTATLSLPAGTVTENGRPFVGAGEAKSAPGQSGPLPIILQSGSYSLVFTPAAARVKE